MATEAVNAVIVGAGQAGARGAKALREAGFAGRIRIFGAEPHLPYERPPLSKALLQDEHASVPFVFAGDHYAAMGVEVELNCSVSAIDRNGKRVEFGSNGQAPYDVLLIATGSRLRPLSIPGLAQEKLLALRTLDESRAIERQLAAGPSVVIVGGGFIGLEVAASAAARGCAVTVVELADRLLPRLGCAEASRIVLDHHRAAGIDVRLGTQVLCADAGGLELSDGSGLLADLVIGGVGVIPDTTLAEAAGLEVNDGIVVDEYGRTSDPAIYAAGDVTRHYNPLLRRHVRLESWQNANLQAEAAGRSMAGAPVAYAQVPWLWSDQGSLNLQIAGAPATIDATITRGNGGGEEGLSVFQFHDGRLVGGVTVNRGKEMPLIRRMIEQGALAADPEQLSDVSVPLRRFLPTRATA